MLNIPLLGEFCNWRGKVQHVNSGEVRYFRDWPTLEAFVKGPVHKGKEPDKVKR